jgi:hypothetical protein
MVDGNAKKHLLRGIDILKVGFTLTSNLLKLKMFALKLLLNKLFP